MENFFYQFLGYLMIAGLIILGIRKFRIDTNFTATDSFFKQAGVTVWFEKKIININGVNYDVNQVSAIEWDNSQVTIKVNDFKRPVHIVKFLIGSEIVHFTQRLMIAIDKAGGPSFQ